jgi:atypical dual specificity phosphatase
MSEPYNFSWIEEARLAAMGLPDDPDTLAWLREQGIELVITLTEDPIRRDWLGDAGLLSLHIPVQDMAPPTLAQVEECVSAIKRAHEQNMAVALHCYAGRGRTGTFLASYLVAHGRAAEEAIARIRQLRPGSIETEEQEDVVREFARSLSNDRGAK